MNREEFNKIVNDFHKHEDRLKSLEPGQKIYELDCADPLGMSYFEHIVVSVDLDKMEVLTKDMSLKGKESIIRSFYLESEINITSNESRN